ncbi:MAG TPA: serine/threonine protein kinase [Cyanobacteria bacterium UBA11372]|nr:serine/threonine protein kinase [Cyanobacteria bacterium UBA11372]
MELLHQPGDIIAERYQIIDTLGQGGIGITYEAEDLRNSQRVAIKALSLRRMTDWKVLELFEREAKVLSQLNHPGIPRYLDYFQVDAPSDRQFYLVQELASGRSLSSLVENNWRPDELEVRRLAAQLLEILIYLHQLTPPVIHRDIQPRNLIRQENGQIFLVDFGAVQDTYRSTFSAGSTVVGTYGYMAPEQFRGQADPATDLYGLGATLLFLLTHKSPADFPQRRLKIDFRSQVHTSAEFTDWLEIMLEPAPEDRFPSAKAALAALRGDLPTLVHHQRQPAGSRIVLNKTFGRLLVDIPPVGLRFDNLFWLGFALLWSGFLFFWTAGAILVGAQLFFPLFSIPFWIAGLGLISALLFSVAGRTRVLIDRQSFRLQWQLFGFCHQVQGRTENIEQVQLASSNYQVNDQSVIVCTLVEGVRSHRFGSWLTLAEKEWLVAEIAAFLSKNID